ncbi:ATP-dependent zinc metalloprotease FtsH [Weissella hellenica]|uniref:ATP-dependent zinc metalloprotease FtsH n=1 Tax=Weissella hellenica TaxID=46256 RepID=A0A4Y4G4T7_WEIHE|nr:ATP-dependent zinc metalloprotease FtsH [Weissella hellenica]NKY67396.1 ATP-dependent metallopeptidase FtsH/Yme1/Tma family protein [Weissella hellenica]GED36486.1 ATP-dependent zinc metalloprotease FtsH [Weissella hellenica]SCC07012.1 cell division protease FtsH [Weissella hellenica]
MKNQRNGNFVRNSLFYVIVVLGIMGLIYWVAGPTQTSNTKTISTSTFMTELRDKKIDKVTIQPGDGVYDIKGEYKRAQSDKDANNDAFTSLLGGNSKKANSFETKLVGSDNIVADVQKAADASKADITTKPQPSNFWGTLAVTMLPLLLIVGLFYLMMGGMNQGGQGGRGNMMGMGKSKAKAADPSENKKRFGDVAGAEEEKQELVEVVEFLKDPKKFLKLGARIPSGVLLEGPPGTGKTLLAKAVAGEAGVPFYSISGSDFVEMFVGVGASRVRDLFENAKKSAPSIIFIDEIDAVGRQRGNGMGGGHDEREQTLNQMLVEMDGFEGNEGVIVMAATNRSDVLDPALLRPGRFDRKILVGRPDVKGREAILKVHAKNKPLDSSVDLKEIAKQTPGFVGADLENLLNESALLAARRNSNTITAKDLDEAEDRVIAGPAKKDRVISAKERNTVAYHEAGHAIVGLVLNEARVVHKVTIVPRGRAGGYAIMLPREDQMLMSKTDAMDQVAGLMGGRAAEVLLFNQQSSGASNDFEQATGIARAMVTQYGMSDKLGMVQLEKDNGPQYGQPLYSDTTSRLIDEEVRHITTQGYDTACDIILRYKDRHEAIAQALLEYETLDEKQILSLFNTGKMPENESEAKKDDGTPMSYEQAKQAANDKLTEDEEAASSSEETTTSDDEDKA